MVEKILNNTTPYGKIRASHEGSLHSSTLNVRMAQSRYFITFSFPNLSPAFQPHTFQWQSFIQSVPMGLDSYSVLLSDWPFSAFSVLVKKKSSKNEMNPSKK